MSLNRCEQRILDYVSANVDERQHWMDKVRSTARSCADAHEAARLLDGDLWAYYVERSQVAEPFRGAVRHEGLSRTSMKNLAEYWVRLWAPFKPKQERTRTYDGL